MSRLCYKVGAELDTTGPSKIGLLPNDGIQRSSWRRCFDCRPGLDWACHETFSNFAEGESSLDGKIEGSSGDAEGGGPGG